MAHGERAEVPCRLYYRLNVFPFTLPPLRERREDIPLLVEHFVRKFAQRQGKSIDSIPAEVVAALTRHDWPGNIRELQNVIERGVIKTAGPVLSAETTEHMKPEGAATPIRTLADVERAHITAILRETSWVVGGPHGAATRLGLARTTFIARMQRLGISHKASAPPALEFTRPSVGVRVAPSHVAYSVPEETCAYSHSSPVIGGSAEKPPLSELSRRHGAAPLCPDLAG